MNKYILETKNLTKRFRKQVAVDDINISIKRNTIYGLLGPNGAGKSTTLKIIMCLLFPTEGEILFNNALWTRKCLNDIGALIESPALYGNLNAEENLRVHTLLMGRGADRIIQLLDTVGLGNVGNKKVSHYSYGMKQRLGIAIALLKEPQLLILDEPTNGLDPVGIKELRKLIKELPSKGITVLLSSHILSEVEHVADYIGIINNGRVRYQEKIDKGVDLEKLFMDVVSNDYEGGGDFRC